MSDEIVMLHTGVASDIKGREIKSDGPIGIHEIHFNRTVWSSRGGALDGFELDESSEIVIRRKGQIIIMSRRSITTALPETQKAL